MRINKRLSVYSISYIWIVPVLAWMQACNNGTPAVPDNLVAQANTLLSQAANTATEFTGTQLGTAFDPEIRGDLANLEVNLANLGDALQNLPKTVQGDALIDAVKDALGKTALLAAASGNTPPTGTPQFYLDALGAAADKHKEILGEITADNPATPPLTPAPAQIAIEAASNVLNENLALNLGENKRAEDISLENALLQDYVDGVLAIDVTGTPTIIPSSGPPNLIQPPADAIVPSPDSLRGIWAQGVELLKDRIAAIENSTLPAGCNEIDIDPAGCPTPVVLVPPAPPVEQAADTTGVPPTLAAAANATIAKFDQAYADFTSTPSGGPVDPSLAATVAVLELELAQVAADINLLDPTVQSQELALAVEKAQFLNEVIAESLSVPPPVPPYDNSNDVGTAGINPAEIPQAPPPPPPFNVPSLFKDNKVLPVTQEEALIEGVKNAKEEVAEVVGENLEAGFVEAPTAQPDPTPAVVAQIEQAYENTAVKADNNDKPDRAGLLREIETGIKLNPVKASTAAVPDPNSQAGNASFLEQALLERFKNVNVVEEEENDDQWQD